MKMPTILKKDKTISGKKHDKKSETIDLLLVKHTCQYSRCACFSMGFFPVDLQDNELCLNLSTHESYKL